MEFEVNGYRMHYQLFGDPAGEPLLWLSGWTGTGEDWKNIFETVPSGFRLIGPDLKGNGRSTGFQGTHSFRQSARDVSALLDYLGVQRLKAIGLSGGGIVLLHMAVQQPNRLTAMIPVSAPPRFCPEARAIQRQFSLESLPQAERTAMLDRCAGGQTQLDWLTEQIHAMAEADDDVTFKQQSLATIAARTLIVFGDRDPLYPVNLACELHQAIPHSSLWVVPNAGHGPVFGPHAARFVETAMFFLRED